MNTTHAATLFAFLALAPLSAHATVYDMSLTGNGTVSVNGGPSILGGITLTTEFDPSGSTFRFLPPASFAELVTGHGLTVTTTAGTWSAPLDIHLEHTRDSHGEGGVFDTATMSFNATSGWWWGTPSGNFGTPAFVWTPSTAAPSITVSQMSDHSTYSRSFTASNGDVVNIALNQLVPSGFGTALSPWTLSEQLAAPVPEPATLALSLAGLIGVSLARGKKQSGKSSN